MTDAIKIQIDPATARNPKTGLALFACASGSHMAQQAVLQELGTDYGLAHASTLFRIDRHGLRITARMQNEPPPPNADVVFDPWDDGHAVDYPDAVCVVRRSALEGQQTFPAWPSAGTLLLEAAAPEHSRRPRVSFCGVYHRPNSRRLMIDNLTADKSLVFHCIRRQCFNARGVDPGKARREFLDSIVGAQYVACPVGVGLFSYRYFETLAAGRVPVVDNHHVGQSADAYTIHAGANAAAQIRDAHRRAWVWPDIAAHNRHVWHREFSPYGWLSTFAQLIRLRFGL